MPTAIVPMGEALWMYYIGWSQRLDVPYHNAIGLARSYDNGKTFERFLPGPVVGTGLNEPYFCGTADVVRPGGKGLGHVVYVHDRMAHGRRPTRTTLQSEESHIC